MSYFKKHWLDLVIGFVCCGLATYYFCTADTDTAIIWLIASCTWLGMSVVEYNHERIEELELKSKKYDALVEEVKALRELVQTYEAVNDQRLTNLEGKNEPSRTLHS
jgi:hypothetical protein